MEETLKKSEDELWKNGAYRDMRQDGLTDRQARFAIGNRHARMESDATALFGAMKEFFMAGVGKVMRDESHGIEVGSCFRKTFITTVFQAIVLAKPAQNDWLSMRHQK